MSTRNRALIVVAAVIVTVSAAVAAAAAVDVSAGVTAINERAEAEAQARDDHNRLVGRVRERLLDSMSDDCFGSRVNSAPQQTVCMLEYVATLQAIQFAS